jgi:peptidoglycan/LPS O-acetylase OafA/YrhL
MRRVPTSRVAAAAAHVRAAGCCSAALRQRAGGLGRRIRRLLPALLVCVLITAVALCLVNPEPGQMLGVGWRSLFGVSNLILHKLAVDYFRPAAELNPFTQTWSLGVEEQFYLLFPLLVWFSGFARTGRFGSRRLLWLLIALVVASCGVFVHQLRVDVPGAFFLLPGRSAPHVRWHPGLFLQPAPHGNPARIVLL